MRSRIVVLITMLAAACSSRSGRAPRAEQGEPLFIIDGMMVDAAPGGALIGINPSDIAKVQVLKDIGSTAQYGARGANGVILITTKRPK